jgi:hypothetical protein
MIDAVTFRANQARVSREERARYANQYVVWSEAGDAILFGDPDMARLFERMDAAVLSGEKHLVSFNALPDEGEYGAGPSCWVCSDCPAPA